MILCDIEDFMLLFIILGLGWSIFIIALAFKVYGACNNIKRIADKYDPEHKRDIDFGFASPASGNTPSHILGESRRQAYEATQKQSGTDKDE